MFRILIRELREFRGRFLFLTLVSLVDGLLGFSIPFTIAEATRGDFGVDRFRGTILILATLFCGSLGLQWLIRRYSEALGPEFGMHLRLRYFSAIQNLPTSQLVKNHSVYVLTLVTAVADGMAGLVIDALWLLPRSVTNLILLFMVTARESKTVAVVNVGILLAFLVVSNLLSRRVVPFVKGLNVSRAALNESFADFMANVLTVKKLGLAAYAERSLTARRDAALGAVNRFQLFHATRWFSLHFLFGLSYLGTIFYILHEVSTGRISAAVLILFVGTYFQIRGNLEWLSERFVAVFSVSAQFTDLEEALSDAEVADAAPPVESWSEIRLSDVEFRYPGVPFSIAIPELTLKRGEVVGIIGESGQGKTTLLHLLSKLHRPGAGSMLLDGVPFDSIGERFFRERMVMISQEVDLFNFSLRENLRLGSDTLGDAELLEGMDELGLRSWVDRLDDGLETVVGERGVRLSAGQRQRLNLLRGFLLERDIFLLDEPTSHLDPQNEERAVAFLKRRLAGKTAVIVSHRPSVEVLCTRIYVMEQHELRPRESGPKCPDSRD